MCESIDWVPIWLRLLVLVIVFLVLFRTVGRKFIRPKEQKFFVEYYKRVMNQYHVAAREPKREFFRSMDVPSDGDARRKTPLRILEIGAASGYNFEFYPPGSQLTVIELNPHFEKLFFEKQAQHPHIRMERFVVGSAEDMKSIEDNSFDVVVSTMVLCSVKNVERVLKEVQRVLVPGGKYYYWEHIRNPESKWILFVQYLAMYTIYDVCLGCDLIRRTDEVIRNFGGFSQIEQQRFRTPLQKHIWKFACLHVKGIATK